MRFSTKKSFLKHFLRINCVGVSFLIKMQAYRPATLFKRHCNTGVFLTVLRNFERTGILKNICERLLLRVFPFMLVWTFSYMNTFFTEHLFYRTFPGDCFLRRRFSQKQKKNHSKTQLDEKNLTFNDLHHFVFLYFSTACLAAFALHNKKW